MKILIRVIAVILILCLAGLGVLVYRKPAPLPAQTGPSAASRQPDTAGGGEFSLLNPPLPAPELGFTARDGAPRHLADFRGKVVLVNLWATWCGPCVEEMPSLDRLQGKLGSALTVLAISEDRTGESAVAPFLAKLDAPHLAVFLDPANGAIKAFGVRGLPTSFLIARDGRVLAMLEGSTAWDNPEMIARIQPYLDAPTPGPAMQKTELTR